MSTMPSADNAIETQERAPSPSETIPPQLLKAMSRVTEISSLPEVTARIVEVVEDPRASAHDMHEIVKNDPALATKILKVVNSSFYGLPAQIASLDRAIVMLGLSAVKNIALAASLARLFKPESVSEQFAPRDVWHHCIAVAVCTKMLCKLGGFADQHEEAFVAGLVHDMGLLVEQQIIPDKLGVVAERCFRTPEDFCAAERGIIGADHQAFGGVLAGKWKFPPALRYAIEYHHAPEKLQAEYRNLATLIHVADTICALSQIGFYLTAQTQQLTAELLDAISVPPAKLEGLYEQLPAQIEDAEHIFAL